MLRQIKDRIEKGNRFLITTHIDLDGDAVGSCFSLYWALVSYKKEAFVYLKDRIPYKYRFLPGPKDPRYLINTLPGERFDTVFVLDCGDFHRVGQGYENLKNNGFIVSIDHHSTNSGFGDINLVDEDASSTAEIVYDLFRYLGIDISYEMAINIYTAILTDTGSFRYENTTSKAFTICGHLTRIGVRPSFIATMVYESHPKERFILLGKVLNTLETHKDGKIAMAHITRDMCNDSDALEEFTDGFVEYIKEIDGIDIAILIRQTEDKRYKLSMRSKGDVDVASICRIFGGGGHKKAAGCHINGDIGTVKSMVLEAIKG
ncbi:MAG TPA: bifunctional oligoribonuclease/PAP phosphatase NrnA [Syntrophorhabdaceae bacterium]|nr:bifunctional oligoribonuclease/PAP phosphatase NrnA [Syntrophorhabdaceae bacterium]HPP41987.1 bifunctional oligoribonuclease/PAP phosphatase NrnA [Syntrophorhabdaceae bacterium]